MAGVNQNQLPAQLKQLKIAMLAVAVFYFGVVSFLNEFIGDYTFDMSADQEFTIHPRSVNTLKQISEPISLTLYFSEQYSADLPELRRHARKVKKLLNQIHQLSDGLVSFQVIEPELFTEQHDFITSLGLQAVTTATQQVPVYLGLYGVNSVDGYQLIPFLSPENDLNLEYQLIELIYKLNQISLPQLSIITDVAISGGYSPLTNQYEPPWQFYSLLSQFYDINISPVKHGVIASQSEAILVISPQGVSENLVEKLNKQLSLGVPVIVIDDPYFNWQENKLDPVKRMLAQRRNTPMPFAVADNWYQSFGIKLYRDLVLQPVSAAAWVDVTTNQRWDIAEQQVTGTIAFNPTKTPSKGHEITSGLYRLLGHSWGVIEVTDKSKNIQALLTTPNGYQGISRSEFQQQQLNAGSLQATAKDTPESEGIAANTRKIAAVQVSNRAEEIEVSKVSFTLIADIDWLQDDSYLRDNVHISDNFTFLLRLIEQNKSLTLSQLRRSVGQIRQLTKQNLLAAKLERTYLDESALLFHREQQIVQQMQNITGQQDIHLIAPELADRVRGFKEELVQLEQAQMQLTLDKHQPLKQWQNQIKLIFVVVIPLLMLLLIYLFQLKQKHSAQLAVAAMLQSSSSAGSGLGLASKKRSNADE